MKKFIPVIAILLIFVVGVGVLAYPLVSAMINNMTARSEATEEIQAIEQMETPEKKRLFDEAEKYNKSLLSDIILTDPFDMEAYNKIGANYPTEVLERGAGHLDNTAFPIGGESTHSVISAHSAFPTETFFDYLTELEIGDAFYIHVLDRTLKYEVDQINVVEPNDTKNLYTIRGEDHVTLLTCTPYSINTHRLLVRGKRVPYDPTEGVNPQSVAVDNNYIYILGYRVSFLTAGIVIALFIAVVGLIVFLIVRRKGGKKKPSRVKKDGDGDG